MIFKTHELPRKYKNKGISKIIFTILAIIWALLLIVITIVIAVEVHNFIEPFCLIILPFVLIGIVWVVILCDMKKAYVEIGADKITAVDYYFGIRREKSFFIEDIIKAEITSGYSMKVRGYRFSGLGFEGLKYIVF